MNKASDKKRFYQCLTCMYTETCELDEKAEDEQGMCKQYKKDNTMVKKINNQINTLKRRT